jgi:hypothetical protein
MWDEFWLSITAKKCPGLLMGFHKFFSFLYVDKK